MVNPIYQPKGAAKEYGDWALNIYTGCPFSCSYCYCPAIVRKTKEEFHSNYQLRIGIVEAVEKQLKTGKLAGKTIHLCFIGDPYPSGVDTTPTRKIINLIKAAGSHVQILTKGGDQARRDFDLLDDEDSFGITVSCLLHESQKHEPKAAPPAERINSLLAAARLGIKTWISFEPVIDPAAVLTLIGMLPAHTAGTTLLKIGKLNHVKNSTDWKSFGLEAERICKANGWNYYIKEDLRKAMQ